MIHLFLIFFYVVSSVSGYNNSLYNGMNEEISKAWVRYKLEYDKSYENKTEELIRFLYFSNKYIYMLEHNEKFMNGEETFTLGLNSLSDRTAEEEQKLLGFMMPERNSITYKELTMLHGYLPSSVDWRRKGVVTPVKNQGSCGSCWAFSSVGALESHWNIYKRQSFPLSEQQLVDCTLRYGNYGCNGGRMDNSFKYLMAGNKGCDLESYYGYTSGRTGRPNPRCYYRRAYAKAFVRNYQSLAYMNEQQLALAVATKGPVAVGIDASQRSFLSYRSGIYQDARCSSRRINHAVLVVGYGAANGVPYWIVKNSWGTAWGENGYIRMLKDRRNMCGIASMASFPVV